MGGAERASQDSGNVIFPRRKQGQHKKNGRKEGVVVTMEILESVFHMPLHKACKALVRGFLIFVLRPLLLFVRTFDEAHFCPDFATLCNGDLTRL